MSQTTYDLEAPLAFAGMISDANGREHSESFAFENSDAEAGYGAGRPAVQGTNDEQFDKPTAAAQTFLGITVHRHNRENVNLAGEFAFVTDEDVEILRRGRVWVVVEEAVVKGDPVFFRHTDNGPLIEGGWRNDAAAGEADAVLNAVFGTTAAIDTVAVIDLNLP